MSPKTKQKAVMRASSDERREQVIQAAVHEFAEHGFRATSTSAIAKRAGISQPYIYALFPNKHELFLATHAYVVGHIRDAFTEAARGLDDPEDRLHAMGKAYMTLLEERDEILVQMQSHAAAADPALRDVVRREFVGLIEHVERVSGVPRQKALDFVACGMLLNVIAALDLPDEYLPIQVDQVLAS
jgi:AcrR family transcriptional regulator